MNAVAEVFIIISFYLKLISKSNRSQINKSILSRKQLECFYVFVIIL